MIISNSEVEAYQHCPRKHWYAYGLKRTPTQKTLPIKHGILGHTILEAYYRAKMEQKNHVDCVQAGMAVLAEYLTLDNQSYEGKVITMVSDRFLAYTEHYKDEPWKILAVERPYAISLIDGVDYAMQLDLLVEWTDGPYKGEKIIVDHKWGYNFQSADEIYFGGQLPKYIWTLQRSGHPDVKWGMVNQIRYRAIKDAVAPKIFMRNRVEPTKERLDNVMDAQFSVGYEIMQKKLERGWKITVPTPYLSRVICKNCFFKLPCGIELDGRDPTRTLAVNYTTNTYGYSEKLLLKAQDS